MKREMLGVKTEQRHGLQRLVRAGALLGVMAVSMAPSAEAKVRMTHEEHKAAQRIEHRIQTEQPNELLPNYDVYWTSPDSIYNPKYRTSIPVKESVYYPGGSSNKKIKVFAERLFRLVQTGDSLATIQARPIPATYVKVPNASTAGPPTAHNPWGELENPFMTTSAIIELNKQSQPVTTLSHLDNSSETLRVGQNHVVNQHGIIG
jgi:hypothetical protein